MEKAKNDMVGLSLIPFLLLGIGLCMSGKQTKTDVQDRGKSIPSKVAYLSQVEIISSKAFKNNTDSQSIISPKTDKFTALYEFGEFDLKNSNKNTGLNRR